MAVRRAADEFLLNGTSPAHGVLEHAAAWSEMDAAHGLHGGDWTSTAGRFPEASHVMCGLFFAVADLPLVHPFSDTIRAGAETWRDQAKWLMTGGHPTFLGAKRHHNAITSALSVLCAADAALDQSYLLTIKTALDSHIVGTFRSGSVNVKERDRLRSGHYGALEVVTILHCLAYLRNIGGDISTSASVQLGAYIRFLCPHLWKIILDDPTPQSPYRYADASGQIQDEGRVSISHHTTTIEWAEALGFETGIVLPSHRRGKTTPYKSFCVTPR